MTGARKIFIVDPQPSTQIICLADAMAVEFDCQVIFLVSSLSVRIYIPPRFKAYNISQLKYLSEQKQLDFFEGVLFCMLYNDLRQINVDNKVFFDRYNIPCLFVERGFFRGTFCQADWQGCNSRSSFAERGQGAFIYSRKQLDNIFRIKNNERPINRAITTFFVRLQFIIFLIAASIEDIALGSKISRRMGVTGYAKQFYRSFFGRRRWEHITAQSKLPSITLFLQLESDTQFLNNGIYGSNEDLVVEFLQLAKYKDFNPIIITHPNEVSDLSYLKAIGFNPGKLKKSTEGRFLALNSTAIFENFLQGNLCCTVLKTWYSYAFEVPAKLTLPNSVDYLLRDNAISRRPAMKIENLEEVFFSGSLPGDLLDRNHELANLAAKILKESLAKQVHRNRKS